MDPARKQSVTVARLDFNKPSATTRPIARYTLLSALLLTLCLATYRIASSTTHNHLPHHHNPNPNHAHNDPLPPPATAVTYPGERIAWTRCGTQPPISTNRTLECSTITVPLDHVNPAYTLPHPQNFTIPLVRLRSTRPPNTTTPIRNLLLNPGGPGASGSAIVHHRGLALAALVGDGFHLLGFDPRGVNASRPLASCFPSDEARQQLSFTAPSARGGMGDRVEEESGALWAWHGAFAQGCRDTMGVWGEYVNTPQTAADMNSILEAVGQDGEGLYYWGFSYGTLLGQTYAAMFPERAKRVIIDGVVNQFDWYGELLYPEEFVGTDRVLEGFVEECLRVGEEDCALAGMVGTKEELLRLVVDGVGRLREEPVGVYINQTMYGVLDHAAVWQYGVFRALYKPAIWRELADNLAALFRGNATPAFLAYGRGEAWQTIGDPEKFIRINDGISGPVNWPVDRVGLVDQLQPFLNQSLFSDQELDHYFSRQAWAIPRTHDYVPKRGVKTAHPLLLLTTTYDPVCPMASVRSAHEAFKGSRIVEVKGYGHCTMALPSMCVARHVREFLTDGKLPDGNVQCEPDGKPYFAKPADEKAAVEAQSLSEDELRIRLAQLELARNSWLGSWA